jgi:hypothetical protein
MVHFVGMIHPASEDSSESNRPPQTTDKTTDQRAVKPRRKYLLIVVILVAVILVAGAAIVYFYKHDYSFTGYRYTVVYTTHLPSGPVTHNVTIVNNSWKATYILGERFSLDVPFYNNASAFSKISEIVCETPGFSFIGCSLPFPFAVPYAPDASVHNVTAHLTFGTPSTPYTGPFIYTAYFDDYPSPQV